jgi:hypothetical protein
MKEILAHPSPTSTELGSSLTQFHLPGLKCTAPGGGHSEVKFTPVELLRASLPHITAADRIDILAALGITFDETSGEGIIETPNGQKRLLPSDPA